MLFDLQHRAIIGHLSEGIKRLVRNEQTPVKIKSSEFSFPFQNIVACVCVCVCVCAYLRRKDGYSSRLVVRSSFSPPPPLSPTSFYHQALSPCLSGCKFSTSIIIFSFSVLLKPILAHFPQRVMRRRGFCSFIF